MALVAVNKNSTQHTENFRSTNVRFLQEQNKQALSALQKVEEERNEAFMVIKEWEAKQSKLENEYDDLQYNLEDLEQSNIKSRAALQQKDEHIRVLSEQNRQLLSMLETEESKSKEKEGEFGAARDLNISLKELQVKFEKMKASGDAQLLAVTTEVVKLQEECKNSRNETEQLQTAARNFTAQAKKDIEELEERLQEAKKQNVMHLQQIQHNEVNEHRLLEKINSWKLQIEELGVQKKSIKIQLDGDLMARGSWSKSKMDIMKRTDMLEETASELRAAIVAAEQTNSNMTEENRKGAENFREMGDKVYSLMDQLRMNQVNLKKEESTAKDREKKIVQLEKQYQLLQQKLALEVEAKQQAEQESRASAQMQALLQKKNKKLEEGLQLALRGQEKAEKKQQELSDKGNALQTQNAYLAARVDGQEEDKMALKAEIRKQAEDQKQCQLTYQSLQTQKTEKEDESNALEAERAAISAELDYIRREDMLDETGRTKPVLIESNDSKLVERLQINEFLYSAQQARNPVPMIIEKVSHILELLHTAQTQSDQYLLDLQKSNSLLQALRQKNLTLYEKSQACESWKLRALMKIVANAFQTRESYSGMHSSDTCNLFLDGLQYTNKELQQLKELVISYDRQDKVHQLHLQDNGLSDDSLPIIQELLTTMPYMKILDLRKNRLSDIGLQSLRAWLSNQPGITEVTRDLQEIRARSGNQIRLRVLVEEQGDQQHEPLPVAFANDRTGRTDMAGVQADDFLASAAGVTAEKGPLSSYIDVPVGSGGGEAAGKSGPEYGGVPVGLGGAGDAVGGLGAKRDGLPDVGGPKGKAKAKARR
ncbi:unnamed protein product [Amoebophrya sp. A25]|nr:unnamed protein product [Amoebophrya sp. A25]|eukprot:GSA25T00003126001.1